MGRSEFLAFMTAVKPWKLGVEDHLNLLGGMPRSTYFHLQRDDAWVGKKTNVSRDTYERMATFVAITQNLQESLAGKHGAPELSEYVRMRSPLFDGVSLMHYLLSPVSLHMTLYHALRVTSSVSEQAKLVQQNSARLLLAPILNASLPA